MTLDFEKEYEYSFPFDEEELANLKDIVQSTAHLIIQFARQGGLGNAETYC